MLFPNELCHGWIVGIPRHWGTSSMCNISGPELRYNERVGGMIQSPVEVFPIRYLSVLQFLHSCEGVQVRAGFVQCPDQSMYWWSQRHPVMVAQKAVAVKYNGWSLSLKAGGEIGPVNPYTFMNCESGAAQSVLHSWMQHCFICNTDFMTLQLGCCNIYTYWKSFVTQNCKVSSIVAIWGNPCTQVAPSLTWATLHYWSVIAVIVTRCQLYGCLQVPWIFELVLIIREAPLQCHKEAFSKANAPPVV